MNINQMYFIKFITFSIGLITYLLLFSKAQVIELIYPIIMIILSDLILYLENFDIFNNKIKCRLINIIIGFMTILTILIMNIYLFNLYVSYSWCVIMSIILDIVIVMIAIFNMVLYDKFYVTSNVYTNIIVNV